MKNYRYQGIALVHLLSRDSVREGEMEANNKEFHGIEKADSEAELKAKVLVEIGAWCSPCLSVEFTQFQAMEVEEQPAATASTNVIALVEKLTNYLGETHALDKASDHYGDDEEGHACSYCEAIQEATEYLARAKGGKL